MKVLFGIDLTDDRKNEYMNGEEFITASNSDDDIRKYEISTERLGEISESADTPVALSIIMWVTFSGLLISLIIVIREIVTSGLVQGFSEHPAAFIICPMACAVYFALYYLQKRRIKKISEAPETSSAIKNAEQTNSELYAGLGVPEDAEDIDVLSYRYVLKNGRPEMRIVGLYGYMNMTVKVFKTDKHLCFADISSLYCIPLAAVTGFRTVDSKYLSLPTWNKDEDYSSERFRKYRIREGKSGDISVKGYSVLEFEDDGEKWEVWFPAYETETIKKIIGK